MRLSNFEIDTINRLAGKYFGNNVQVYLFGSRTNPNLRGGDIDLFISGENNKMFNLKTKIMFLADLKTNIGDQKIDLVFDTEATKAKPAFYQSINKSKIELKC